MDTEKYEKVFNGSTKVFKDNGVPPNDGIDILETIKGDIVDNLTALSE